MPLPGPPPTPTARNGTVDIMRLIAAAGIVWFHAHAWGQTPSYAALSLFIVFLIVLPLQRPWSGSFASYTWQRADRLLRPWLVWSLIYAAFKMAQALAHKQPIAAEFDRTMLLAGTEAHLWFLPFGFACSLAAFWIVKVAMAKPALTFPCMAFFATLSLPASAFSLNLGLATPLAQWCYGLPAVLFGLAIHFANLAPRKLLYVAIATVISWLLAMLVTDTTPGSLSLILGVNLSILALAIPIRSQPWMRWAATVSMPIYLSHPLFLALLKAGAGLDHGAVAALLAICLSMALGAAILKSGWARWLL